MPRVSIVMACHNEDDGHLSLAIESILAQTFQDFEFIIIDDGSTNGCSQVIAEYRARCGKIRLLRNAENIGLARSLNRGIDVASGAFIARQDADDISAPNRLEAQIGYMEQMPECVFLGSWYAWMDEENRLLKFQTLPVGPQQVRDFMVYQDNPFAHGSVLFKREIVDKVGPYDTEIAFGEDYEYWVRIQEAFPLQMFNLAQFLYFWRAHSVSMSSQTDQALRARLVDQIRQAARERLA